MASKNTPNLGFTYGWSLGEGGWKEGTDRNYELLDLLVQPSVKSRSLNAPPASPAAGDRYLVDGNPTGAWAGHSNHFAYWNGASWLFVVPKKGWFTFNEADSKAYRFDGSAWSEIQSAGGDGGNGGAPITVNGKVADESGNITVGIPDIEGLEEALQGSGVSTAVKRFMRLHVKEPQATTYNGTSIADFRFLARDGVTVLAILTIKVDTVFSGDTANFGAHLAIDGSKATIWASESDRLSATFLIEFVEGVDLAQDLGFLEVTPRNDAGYPQVPRSYTIYPSADGNWFDRFCEIRFDTPFAMGTPQTKPIPAVA